MMNKRNTDIATLVICIAWASIALPRIFTGKWSAEFEAFIIWGGGCFRLILLAVASFAAVQALRTLDRDNPAHLSQTFLAGGFLTFVLSQMTLFILTIKSGGKTPYPSIADLGFSIACVLLIVAVALGIRAWLRLDLFPDGGKKAATAGILIAVPVVSGAVWTIRSLAAATVPPMQMVIDITYPVLNTILLILTAAMLRLCLLLGKGSVGVVWRSLLAGFLAMAIADVMYSFFAGFNLEVLEPTLDLLYTVAYALFARGTLLQWQLLRD